MADTNENNALIVAWIGGAAGLAGGAVTALSETMTRKQVAATVISGLGFGAFVPPALISMWQYPPGVAGIIGFVCGLTAVGLTAGFKKISLRWADKPGAFIPQIRDAMKDDPATPNKGAGS